MKKRSPRAIPDFAHRRSTAKPDAVAAPATDRPTPRVAPATRAKPQSTSAKSGRRGQ